jgi:hypothetical protein
MSIIGQAGCLCRLALLVPVLPAGLILDGGAAEAAEGAQSFYQLGLHGPLAAVSPPPGVYFQNDTLIYVVKASMSDQLPYVGRVTAGVKADAYIDLPTVLWQTPLDLSGVRIGVTITQPFGAEYVIGRPHCLT